MTSALPLKHGDLIGIAASSSPFERNFFDAGIETLKRLGFHIRHRDDLFAAERYLAGPDTRRAEELTALIEDPEVKAILFARGGYGCQRMIPWLSADRLRAHRKPVVGFSDVTALLTYLRQSCQFPTMYGPVVTQLGRVPRAATCDALLEALTTAQSLGTVSCGSARTLKPGAAAGPVVGGCLSMIATSIGTPYELKMDGAILFIEDTNEKVYALDRMLTQLRNAGMLMRTAGIIVGSMNLLPSESHDVYVMLADVLRDFTGPVIVDFPAGHTDNFVSLPLGIRAELTAPQGDGAPTLTYVEEWLS